MRSSQNNSSFTSFSASSSATLFLLLLFFTTSDPLYAAAPTAMETVQSTINEILTILQDPAIKGEKFLDIKKKRLWVIMDRIFNYTALSTSPWENLENNYPHPATGVHKALQQSAG